MLEIDDLEEKIIKFKDKIEKANKICILHHTVPDMDAIGSSCALCIMLRNIGKKAYVLMEKPLVDEYKYFGIDDIIIYKQMDDFDLIVSTDCGDTTRFTIYEKMYLAHKNRINIDHHITNTNYAELNIVDSKRSSACEIVYLLNDYLNLPLDKRSRNLLYAGIIRDCGGFMYNNTSPSTHEVVARLIGEGIDFEEINLKFMLTNTLKSTLLLRRALNTMKFYYNGRVVIANLSESDFIEENAILDDSGAIVSRLLSIEGVEIAIMISEAKRNVHKISFRSKNDFDVSLLASAFGGGGHKKASGCQLRGPFSYINNQLLNQIKKVF